MCDKIEACELKVYDCGFAEYSSMLALQMQLWEQRYNNRIPNTVLIVEHPSVITLGARKSENKLLKDEESLRQEGIDLVHIRRGGGTTAHNPGQAVLYPIVDLQSLHLGVSDYIRELEAVGIEFLNAIGIKADRRKGYPGLWVGEKKIGSVGVQIKRWVTLHGMAINVRNNMSIFENIIPCGLDGVVMTNVVNETGEDVEMEEVKQRLAELCISHWSDVELGSYEKYR